MPTVNQIELHPLLQQAELRAWHAEHGIATEAWSPLAQGEVLKDETLAAIAAHHERTVAQVSVSSFGASPWAIGLQASVAIPCSACHSRSSACCRQRVELDLVDRRLLLGLGAQPLEVLDAEVGDADRAGLPSALSVRRRARSPGRGPDRAAASGSGRGRPARGRALPETSRWRPGRVEPCSEFQSLVVMKISSRGTPDAAIAGADPRSLR